jgi:hypothetical protein
MKRLREKYGSGLSDELLLLWLRAQTNSEPMLKTTITHTVIAPDGRKVRVTSELGSGATEAELINKAREEFSRKKLNWQPFIIGLPVLFLMGFAAAWLIYFVGRYVVRGFLSVRA